MSCWLAEACQLLLFLGRTNKLQVMRVESTDGQKHDIGLYLDPPTAMKVLEKVRSLLPYKPWQFKTGDSLIALHLDSCFMAGLCQL